MQQRILKVYGLNESSITGLFNSLKGKTGDVILRADPCFPESRITLSLHGEDDSAVTKELERVEKKLKKLIGPSVFASGNQTMEEVIGLALMEERSTLSVAESCTGGLVSHRLTNVPGSSGYFMGAVVVYSNQSKVNFLQVYPETLERYGAVSDHTVREMAVGIRLNFKTDLGLAVTGIAGPDGGSREKPVGTVHFGLAVENNIFSGKYLFQGNRELVKLNASTMALDWVRRFLNGDPFLPGI